MDKGWICLHRSILDWEWYDDINATRLFIHCLLRANHAPKKWRGLEIKRGQFWTSLESLSNETGLSAKQVRTALEKLASELASSGQARGRMITVINYENYQERASSRANEGQAKGKLRATNNNDNNENNETKSNRATKMPKDWKPNDKHRELAASLNVSIVDQLERFRDYSEANGKTYKSWNAAFNNWLRNAKSFQRDSSAPKPQGQEFTGY